jgi:hypothetical protein
MYHLLLNGAWKRKRQAYCNKLYTETIGKQTGTEPQKDKSAIS